MFKQLFRSKWSPRKELGSYFSSVLRHRPRICCGTPTADEALKDFKAAHRLRNSGMYW
jgi:hypothetical protein